MGHQPLPKLLYLLIQFRKPEHYVDCTPRVCSPHNAPVFEIGSEGKEVWVKIDGVEIIETKKPKDLKVNSHNKEETMIMHEADIFDEELKEKFSLFSFVHHTRKLIEGMVMQKMYPAQIL